MAVGAGWQKATVSAPHLEFKPSFFSRFGRERRLGVDADADADSDDPINNRLLIDHEIVRLVIVVPQH